MAAAQKLALCHGEVEMLQCSAKITEAPSPGIPINLNGTLHLTNKRIVWVPSSGVVSDILYASIKGHLVSSERSTNVMMKLCTVSEDKKVKGKY
jgi:hypothetical protein